MAAVFTREVLAAIFAGEGANFDSRVLAAIFTEEVLAEIFAGEGANFDSSFLAAIFIKGILPATLIFTLTGLASLKRVGTIGGSNRNSIPRAAPGAELSLPYAKESGAPKSIASA